LDDQEGDDTVILGCIVRKLVKNMKWIELAQDHVQWKALVLAVLDLPVY